MKLLKPEETIAINFIILIIFTIYCICIVKFVKIKKPSTFIYYFPTLSSLLFIIPCVLYFMQAHTMGERKVNYYIVASALALLFSISSINHFFRPYKNQRSYKIDIVQSIDFIAIFILIISGLFLHNPYNGALVVIYSIIVFIYKNGFFRYTLKDNDQFFCINRRGDYLDQYKKSLIHWTIHVYVIIVLILILYTDYKEKES
jgi:hypothetical protein